MTATDWLITEPCIIDGMPAEIYHADPVPGGSLSSSGARKMLRCPARFRYGPDKASRRLEYGTAAHTVTLGTGPPLEPVPFDDWRKAGSRELAARAREAGRVPVLARQYDAIREMAARVAADPWAGQLFRPGSGRAEQSFFWPDAEFGVWRRARLDWLPWGTPDFIIVPDYKTAESAARESVSRAMANYGYHVQAAFYRDAVAFFHPGAEVRFVLVVQETDPPYLVECYEVDTDAMAEGARRVREALEKYRDCRAADSWPGYNPGAERIPAVGLPRWAYKYDEDW